MTFALLAATKLRSPTPSRILLRCGVSCLIAIVFIVAYAESEELRLRNACPKEQDPSPKPKEQDTSPKPKEQGIASFIKTDSPITTEFGKICIVVRTYHGHANVSSTSPFTLSTALIPSFLDFEYRNWVALFVDTDADRIPFSDLGSILGQYKDDRLIALNSTLVADGKPVIYDGLESAYPLTDKAIRFCPNDTKWLLVTQGDNGYLPEFLSNFTLSTDVDIIAVDWHSRSGCDCKVERFCCHPNLASLYETDLGSNILNFQRYIKENRLYESLPRDACQDGHMLGSLRTSGWTVKRVERCLFFHNPSPAGCQKFGGWYWVNNENRCATKEEAMSKVASKELSLKIHAHGHMNDLNLAPRCLHRPNER
mmetsp:Transcript_25556/g.42045  ORF Transcript_25556/g.42045 Transcript_25556/m.42045 type:complete len:368 (-) Transcript_25556:57-1160(-)|eukprot:CAMPEP_0184673020 /NCGR_PEP_ID=MMETSP0308-20130426/86441_1 /TAXON_ID=38269 /ORGANISM="Gloeochaete witrockiana, Strain SAG 46.84" /LENGTH=367 /DNA_ID=CAMNT_0027120451 /DNA_START=182 /DNA_END=1285 /DNA_ORIENTATION=+